jgi:hypothetical protein
MIGVIAKPSDQTAVEEFFELFKTPWEWYRGDRRYDVILCAAASMLCQSRARLVVIYSGRRLPSDAADSVTTLEHRATGRSLVYETLRIPIYGDSVALGDERTAVLLDTESGESVGGIDESDGTTIVRIGYDLFDEVRHLLTRGQPPCNASFPTLDHHIAILRDLIKRRGIPLVEIPPVPAGYSFIACLTHDVDHPSIRRHRFDHTAFGFLYRAVVRSLVLVLQRRMSLRHLLRNWIAAFKLPFVYLGLAKDFWLAFDRYPELEGGPHSSFFVIPFEGYPGLGKHCVAPKYRASGYAAEDIVDQLRNLNSAGCEIGLHGIDAWLDADRGRQELAEITRLMGVQSLGVRMHWLYGDEWSPIILEAAGADYDSSVGYNDAVGYRAGTAQVYRPLGATRLLELPLHIMDTALFFQGRLDLSAAEALNRVNTIINHAVTLGGVVTVNWHDRSIAPERLWDEFYASLVDDLRRKGAWIVTASDTVRWFRQRRSAEFETVDGGDGLQVRYAVEGKADLPVLRLRVHRSSAAGSPARDPEELTTGWRDMALSASQPSVGVAYQVRI